MASPLDENSGIVILDTSAGDVEPVASFEPFTKAERIKQLNDIDKSITKMLRSAGLAIETLTIHQATSTLAEESHRSFNDATNTYLEGLHSVDVQLKRQIHGLYEAGIIAMGKESPNRLDGQNPDTSRVTGDNVALDVGWLNSRSGKVGRDMEAELWAKARKFLEGLELKKYNSRGQKESEKDVEDEEMSL